MEIRPEILTIVFGAAVVTVVPRVLPLVVLSRFELPLWLRQWLAFIPVAVLAALLASDLAFSDHTLVFKWQELVAIALVFAVAYLRRSLIGAVTAGVVAVALLRALF